MWKVEVWDKGSHRWRFLTSVQSFEEAKKAVCFLAIKGNVGQATLPKAAPDEYRCMRAFPGRGWQAWTGSGGLLR